MNRFRQQFLTNRTLLVSLRRFLLGIGVCSVVLAGDSRPDSTQDAVASDARESSLHIQMSVNHRPAVSYALIRAHDTAVFVGASRELRRVHRLQKQHAGAFLWLRQGDSEYLLEEATAVAELLQRWQTLKAPEQQMAALEQQLQPYTEQLEAHADELEEAAEQWAGNTDHQQIGHQQIEQLHEKMQALHEQIEPISEQMESLGQQIETLADDAHQFTLQRIDAAVQGGKVKPIPAS